MSAVHATIWQRTGAGDDELRDGRLGLNARLRQLLRLIDGRRDEHELMRLMAAAAFDEQLRALVDHGLVRPANTAPSFRPAIIDGLAMARDVTASGATMPAPPMPAPPIRGEAMRGEAMRDQTMIDQTMVDPASAEALEQTRMRMIVALNELIGEHGAPLAARLQRCTALRELRELLPATLAIVEAVGGPTATHDFLHRAGRI